MINSIFNSIKKLLNVELDDTSFDDEILMHINTVFGILTDLGVGPEEGYFITGTTEVWSDYISDMTNYQMVKTYIYSKVKLVFDPPTSGSLMEALKSTISELEFRLNGHGEHDSDLSES